MMMSPRSTAERVLGTFFPASFAFVLCLASPHAPAQERPARPEVWMAPPGHDDGRCFRELFAMPEDWEETRSLVDVLFYADHNLNRQFNDEDLRKWFGRLNQWKLKFAMEVGAIKPWGLTGEKVFEIQRAKWDRFQGLGANLYAIAMDEPLLCCREHIHKSDDYAVQETANFIALVRKHFPHMLIGDIETFPSVPVADHAWWIDALNKRLAELGVRGIDFYRLDVNWANFIVQDRGCWGDVRKIELECRKRKVPFSLIYWASGQPLLQRKGLADDSTWQISIMHQGYAYAMVDGRPDQYVIESWIGAPSRCVPEDEEWTFTRSVRDFVKTFITPRP